MITKVSDTILSNVSVSDPAISDHFAVFGTLNLKKPPFEKVISRSRNLKSIVYERFLHDLSNSSLVKNPSDDVNCLVDQYDSQLSSLLNSFAPLKECIITLHPPSPWFTPEIEAEIKKRRKLEKKWRTTHLTVDRDLFITQRNTVKSLIKSYKSKYFSELITEHKSDPKILFSTFERMTFKKGEKSYPPAPSSSQLACSFADFFIKKISNIQRGFQPNIHCATNYKPLNVDNPLISFSKVSTEYLQKVVGKIASKSCELDPLPAKILKMSMNCLLPVISKVVNLSLETGKLPTSLKSSVIKPLLKKQGMPTDEFTSFRPISNLKFLSKVIEKWLLYN
jgi:hypothetical protein